MHGLVEVRVFICGETSPVAQFMTACVPREGEFYSVMQDDHEIIRVTWFDIQGKPHADVHLSSLKQ